MFKKSERTALPKVLAVATRGGHWIELMRLRPAFEGFIVKFVTSVPDYKTMVPPGSFVCITEANRQSKLKMLRLAIEIFFIVLRLRPNVVISTGSAPGYLAIRIGKWFGAKTIWIESIANANEFSLSGQLARPFADIFLTQWEHLAKPGVAEYHGSVL
jgi:UDP-N-acetylglucosamine:LPS N-acetylglucosamine transferase